MCRRRFARDPGSTPGRWRSLLWRSGVTFPLQKLAFTKTHCCWWNTRIASFKTSQFSQMWCLICLTTSPIIFKCPMITFCTTVQVYIYPYMYHPFWINCHIYCKQIDCQEFFWYQIISKIAQLLMHAVSVSFGLFWNVGHHCKEKSAGKVLNRSDQSKDDIAHCIQFKLFFCLIFNWQQGEGSWLTRQVIPEADHKKSTKVISSRQVYLL